MNFLTTIGLEVHAQLKTQTKLFCRCLNTFGKEANTLTCPVCLALPGALPVLNREAVALAIKAGIALNCEIHKKSIFARKNYFYPDLPKGYQISQYEEPLCTKGFLTIEVEGKAKKVGIHRAHMEEDAGKLLHGDNLLTKEGSLVDLNRAGVPLIEIVGEPEMETAQEAVAYLKKLRSIVRYTDVCDGNMEEGSFRCDANVSIREKASDALGTKVEIKNMNSFKHVQKAIEYEIGRQIQAKEGGEKIVQETRLWNPDKGVTLPMRSKEHAHDYRYFPEPDLLPLQIEEKWIHDIRGSMPELPDNRKVRFEKEFQLPPYDANVLTAEKEIAQYYEKTVQLYGTTSPEKYKTVSNFVMAEILGLANARNESIDQLKIRPEQLSELLKLIDSGTISGKIAKEILSEMAEQGGSPTSIVEKKGMSQINNEDELRRIVSDIVGKNPGQKKDYLSGKEKLFGFFVGQVMKATNGRANPNLVNQFLKDALTRGV